MSEEKGVIKIRVIKENLNKRKFSFKEISLSVLTGIIFAGLFSSSVYIFATPPSSPYSPGQTLNPNCASGTANCTVITPVPYTGATSALDLGSQNFTTTGIGKFGYNSSNYATLTVNGSGDLTIATTSSSFGGNINLNSAVTGDATILGSSGTLVFGGSGGANNENLKFDFETYNDKIAVTSGTGVTTFDLGSLNLITTGNLTLGASTPGTLVTRVKDGSPIELDTNGSLVVDSANGRLYFRYGGAWHYIAQTAGFQIPDFETVDSISGEQIKEGDIVLGMINKAYEDNALHGVWIKWDSVKKQLIKDIQAVGGISPEGGWASGSTGQTESILGVDTTSLIDKVTNIIFSLGIGIKDGIVNIANLATEKFSAKIARTERLEMVDKATGDIYCTWIERGEWQKAKGECGSSEVASAAPQISLLAQVTTDRIANQVKEELTEKIQSEVESQVQAEVQQQLQDQQTLSTNLGQTETPSLQEQALVPLESSGQASLPAQIKEEIQSEVESQVQAEVQQQLQAQQIIEEQQPTLFDIISAPFQIKYQNGIILFVISIAFIVVALCILLFMVRRQLRKNKIAKVIGGVKERKENPQ